MLSLIVAAAENGVIGRDNALPWRLSADLKRFKALTTGHAIIMGRKTYASIGRPLPRRVSIVISRQACVDWGAAEPPHHLVQSLDAALALVAPDDEAFVIGGAQIYALALPRANRLYLTRVHAQIAGDAVFPAIDPAAWHLVHDEAVPADEKNEYPTSYQVLDRVRGA